MKLAYLHSANLLDPSANAIQVARMCSSFSRVGAEVTLFHPRYARGNPLADEELRSFYGLAPEVRVRALPAPFSAALMQHRALPLVKLAAYLPLAPSLLAVDVIYTRCFSAAALFGAASRVARRTQVIFEAHEAPPSPVRARVLPWASGVVTITGAIARELTVDRGRLLVAPDAVLDEWLEAPIDKELARSSIGLESGPLVVYTGRLHRGTLELLLSCARELEGVAEVVLLGMPPGSFGDAARWIAALRARVDREGRRNVIVRPPVPAAGVRAYQCAADVLLAPYTGELRWAPYTSPLKLFEYMAAGRPIVASRLPVLEEVIAHDRNAWLVPPGSGAALAAGVRAMLDNPATAERLARAARASVQAHTWDRRARHILDFIGSLR